ncbi:MAG: hypothetical protein AAFY71_07845 [Bacteroidota bacterium]
MKIGKIKVMDKVPRTAGLVVGGSASAAITEKLVPMVYKQADAKLKHLAAMGIGLFGPDVVLGMMKGKKKGQTSQFIEGLGDGIVAVAGQHFVGDIFNDVFARMGGQGNPGIGYAYQEDYLVEEGVSGYAIDKYDNAVMGYDEVQDRVMGAQAKMY